MPRAFTSLSDAQIAKIKESGISIYQFLQNAVDEKIKNDAEKIEINRYEEFLKYHFVQINQKIEEKILKAVEIHLGERRTIENKFDEMIERYENSREVAKSILQDISTQLKRIEGKPR